MACGVYKVFTRERGTYQDINGIQEYFRDYINNNLQLMSDCVSTNTANKVVKRDASGNFAAGNIAANLTGTATNAASATNATNVTTNINGHAITDIFESDGVTAKRATKVTNINGGGAGQIPYQSATDTTAMLAAGTSGQLLKSNGASAPSWMNQSSITVGTATNATNATNADKLDGKHWVTIASGSVNVTNAGMLINLRSGYDHRFYRFSAYSQSVIVAYGYPAPVSGSVAYATIQRSNIQDHFYMYSPKSGGDVITYQVDVWE